MFGDIPQIENPTGTNSALIIDNEVDFCLLMKFYLSKKNFNVDTAPNLEDALQKIEKQKPDLIIADKKVVGTLEHYLKDKVDSIEGYRPKIFCIGDKWEEPEGAVMYTLKKDYSKNNYQKKNYYKKPSSFWEKIIEYIKSLFR